MSQNNIEERVLSKINLDHKSLQNGVQNLIEWLNKTPYLPNVTDEELLKAFIVGSKSVERAKERLDRYFTARTKCPALLGNRDTNDIAWPRILKMAILPGLTDNDYNVFFCKLPTLKRDIELFDYTETNRVAFMMLEHHLRAMPIVSGQVILIDAKDICMDLLTKFISSNTAAAVNVYQHSLPIRMKVIVFFNVSSAAETFFNTFLKVFFSDKLKQRFIVHSDDHKVLSKYLPLDMLPDDYEGGKSPSIDKQFENLKKLLETDHDWLLKEGSEGSDESKRPKNDTSVDQIQGTFRKLEVD